MQSVYDLVNNELVWFEERGIGYFNCSADVPVYDQAYFTKYLTYMENSVGQKLNQFRVDLVNAEFGDAEVVDVGIGCGAFVEARENTKGFDINPAGVEWLNSRELFKDPYLGCSYATFWDSLEHIERPWDLLERITSGVIVSIPIFSDVEHVIRSKHFRKDEHFWYFTRKGFISWMESLGWVLTRFSNRETELGREDIGTFVFRRMTFHT